MKSTAIVAERPTTCLVPRDARDAEFAADIVDLCVTVVDGQPEDGWGSFDPETRVITLLPNLGTVQRRSALARLLGHAFHDHTVGGVREESEACAWGARRLISEQHIAATLEAIDWIAVLARELDVMPSDVDAYLTSLTDEQWAGMKAALVMLPRGLDSLRTRGPLDTDYSTNRTGSEL